MSYRARLKKLMSSNFYCPRISKYSQYSKKMLLMDNLNERFLFGNTNGLSFWKEMIQQDTPLMSNFVMILFCLDGKMQTRFQCIIFL